MSKARRRRNRRKRRQERAFLATGAKPKHKLQAGRTGWVHHKRTRSKQPLGLVTSYPITAPASVMLASVLRVKPDSE